MEDFYTTQLKTLVSKIYSISFIINIWCLWEGGRDNFYVALVLHKIETLVSTLLKCVHS